MNMEYWRNDDREKPNYKEKKLSQKQSCQPQIPILTGLGLTGPYAAIGQQ